METFRTTEPLPEDRKTEDDDKTATGLVEPAGETNTVKPTLPAKPFTLERETLDTEKPAEPGLKVRSDGLAEMEKSGGLVLKTT